MEKEKLILKTHMADIIRYVDDNDADDISFYVSGSTSAFTVYYDPINHIITESDSPIKKEDETNIIESIESFLEDFKMDNGEEADIEEFGSYRPATYLNPAEYPEITYKCYNCKNTLDMYDEDKVRCPRCGRLNLRLEDE